MPIHIEAKEGDVAGVVLLVGNPQRAQYIAENYLDNAECYTQYRCMYGYTGYYNDRKISVQTSGMGSPSIGIIIEELNMLGAKCLIRLGTCGSISDKAELGDLIISTGAHSSHNIFSDRFGSKSYSAVPDFLLTKSIYENAERLSINVHTGTILTSEIFYEESNDSYKKYSEYGTLAVEMESYILFALSAKYKIKAATVLTVSDIVFEQKRADKRIIKTGVDNMTLMVCNTICKEYNYLTSLKPQI